MRPSDPSHLSPSAAAGTPGPRGHRPWQRALWRCLGVMAISTAGLASLVGSGGGGGGGDSGGSTPPSGFVVINTGPTNGATGVATNATVSATFSENLANTPTLVLTSSAGNVAGTVSRAGATVTFTPSAPLAVATTYTATVSGAAGNAGGAQSGSTQWVFITAGTTGLTTISGLVDYESVATDAGGIGRLLYNSITNRPVRGATVEVLPAGGGAALASGVTSATGTYSLTIATPESVIVRVRAEMKKPSGAGGTWDFSVLDNTRSDALYVMDSPAFTPVAGANTRNLRATSGWGGIAYTGARVAGPFSILDVVYEATQKILSASPNATFPALQLMWSVNNRNTGGSESTGLIGTSFYRFDGTRHRIFILGFADSDTDEYDRPVIAHEFGHYFQNAFSRDDSVGGSHSGIDLLDMRVAFSEGWGNAWSGMALNSRYYTDSIGPGQQSGFSLDLAAAPSSNLGFFSEGSVQYLLYSWHANPAIGFTPIFNVMAGMRTTLLADATVSSIHSFAHHLKQAVPAQATAVNNLLASQQITVADAQGSTEVNGGSVLDALPVYRTHTAAAGNAQNYCLNDNAASSSRDVEANKLGTHLFIRFTTAAAGNRVITVTGTTPAVVSDPDFEVLRNNGTSTLFEAATNATEQGTVQNVPAGTHLIVLYDYALSHGPNSAMNNGRHCFNVTIQ